MVSAQGQLKPSRATIGDNRRQNTPPEPGYSPNPVSFRPAIPAFSVGNLHRLINSPLELAPINIVLRLQRIVITNCDEHKRSCRRRLLSEPNAVGQYIFHGELGIAEFRFASQAPEIPQFAHCCSSRRQVRASAQPRDAGPSRFLIAIDREVIAKREKACGAVQKIHHGLIETSSDDPRRSYLMKLPKDLLGLTSFEQSALEAAIRRQEIEDRILAFRRASSWWRR
jgi:hypothetical protein